MWISLRIASLLFDIANIGLIIGLVVGVVSTIIVFWTGNIKEEYLKHELSEAKQKAVEAKSELDNFKSPRDLTLKEKDFIVSQIQKFAGQEFFIVTYWDLKESKNFTDQLYQILIVSGWKFFNPGGMALLGGVEGIFISIFPNSDPMIKDAANTLALSLQKIGHNVLLKSETFSNGNNKIMITIGTKPIR